MKSWIVLLSVSMLSAAFFLLVMTADSDLLPKKVIRSNASVKKVSSHKKTSPIMLNRGIAAISPNKANIAPQYIGFSKDDLKKYPQSNKRASNWKEKFIKTLKVDNQNLSGNTLKIKHKRSIVKKENKSSRNLEHIVVRLKLANGNPFSYEALVDSETGAMIQSWNKTRYEHREPTLLDGTNKLLMRSN